MAHSERYFNGAYLRLVRKRHQVTQQELAQTLAVSRQMISVWESGKTEMSETMLSRLAQALGEDFGELLERYYGEPAEEELAQDNGEEVARTQFEMIYEGVGLNEGGTIGAKTPTVVFREGRKAGRWRGLHPVCRTGIVTAIVTLVGYALLFTVLVGFVAPSLMQAVDMSEGMRYCERIMITVVDYPGLVCAMTAIFFVIVLVAMGTHCLIRRVKMRWQKHAV